MKELIKNIIASFGVGLLWVSTLVLAWTFYAAYTTSSKRFYIDVNSIGEAHIEALFFVPLVLLMGTYAFWRVLQKTKNEIKGKIFK